MDRYQWNPYKKIISILSLIGWLVLGGCLPPKTIIAFPEAPMDHKTKVIVPDKPSPSEEQIKLEKLLRQLEETEQRLLETQRKTEEALKKVENASEKTGAAADRIQKAQEKIEAVERKENP